MSSTATIMAPKRTERIIPKTSPMRYSETRKVTKSPTTLSYAQFEKLTVMGQVRRAFMAGNRLSAAIGLVIGGFVPVATYTLVHFEVNSNQLLWVLVAGGLIYSAITVFKWANAAFGNPVKAVGFCVLLEGILTFSHVQFKGIQVLSLTALFILVFINAVSSACALQVRKG